MKKIFIIILPNLLRIVIIAFLIYKASVDLNFATILLLILFVLYSEGQNILNKKYMRQINGMKEVITTIIDVLDNHKDGIGLFMKVELLKKNPFLAEYIEKPDINNPNTQ